MTGIGITLLIDAFAFQKGWRGLGLKGVLMINLCGGDMLLGWLLFSSGNMPIRGHIILWTVVMAVLATGLTEMVIIWSRRKS